jgi:hypothetical protein
MSSNQGKTISIYKVAQMVGRAFPLAFTSSNILSGFATTGISSMNEDDFLSSYVTDRPELTVAQKESFTSELYAASVSLFKKSAPSSSRKNEATVSPDIIRPFPEAQPWKPASKGRKKGKSRILTDTHNKEEIELVK